MTAGQSDNVLNEILAAAAAAHRVNAVLANSELLINGQLLVTPRAYRKLLEEATPGAAGSPPAGMSIPVKVIPDDGQPHDVGAGKVAVVSPLDNSTIFVFPADLVDNDWRYHGRLGAGGIE